MNLKDKFIYTYTRLFGRKRFYKLNFLLMRLGLSGMGVMNYQDYFISGEDYFKKFVTEKYKPQVIFDVGCNEGNYIAPMIGSGADIHCFEPVPKTYARLTERFEQYKNVKVNKLGLSNDKTTTFIYDYATGDGSSHASLFEENINYGKDMPVSKIEVQLDTLDNYIKSNNILEIDLLKVDTEGNEIFVLQGAKESLAGKKIKVLQFEFSYLNKSAGSFFKDFFDVLEGYNLYRLLPQGFFPLSEDQQPLIYEQYAFQNVVAFRKDIDIIRPLQKV